MEEPTRPLPADGGELPNGAGESAPPAPVEVAVEEYGEEETGEEPPRSATAKQEEANAALGSEGSRPFTMRELLGEIKEEAEADGRGGGAGSAFGEGNGIVSADAEGSSSRFVVETHVLEPCHLDNYFDSFSLRPIQYT